MPPYGPNDPRLLQHQEPLIVWALIPIALVLFVFLLLYFNRPSESDQAETEEYWDRVEREEGDDAGLVDAAIAPAPIDLDPDAAIDALAGLGRLEREAQRRLDAERAAAHFTDADGFHYVVPDWAFVGDKEEGIIDEQALIDAEPPVPIEARYERLFENLAMQQDAIRANLARYLHYRRKSIEAHRENDREPYRRELAELETIEARYRLVDEGSNDDL